MNDYREVFGVDAEPWREHLGALRLTLADESAPPWQIERARAECEALVKSLNESAAERGKIAVEVVNWLLSEMVVDRAYEYNGKPIYNSLTREHIDYVIAEFNGEHERSDVRP